MLTCIESHSVKNFSRITQSCCCLLWSGKCVFLSLKSRRLQLVIKQYILTHRKKQKARTGNLTVHFNTQEHAGDLLSYIYGFHGVFYRVFMEFSLHTQLIYFAFFNLLDCLGQRLMTKELYKCPVLPCCNMLFVQLGRVVG